MSDIGARKTLASELNNPFSFKTFTKSKAATSTATPNAAAAAAKAKRPSIFDNVDPSSIDADDTSMLPSGVRVTLPNAASTTTTTSEASSTTLPTVGGGVSSSSVSGNSSNVPNESFLANVPTELDAASILLSRPAPSLKTQSIPVKHQQQQHHHHHHQHHQQNHQHVNDSFDSHYDDDKTSRAPRVNKTATAATKSRGHSTPVVAQAHATNDSFESDDDDIDAAPLSAPHALKPPLSSSSREKELRLRAEVAEMALKEVQDKHAKLSIEHETLKKAHETMRLDLDSAKRQAQRLKTKDEQETSALNDMVEKIEQNLLNATQRAQTAEARVAELERQLGRDRDAVDQAQIDALGDEESRQLLKLYRGRLRMCQESGADASARLTRSLQVVLGAMKQIQAQSGDMQVIVDTMKTFGRVALLDDNNDRF
jgi:hypothetical protein